MTAQDTHPKRIYRQDYAPPSYLVERAALFFTLDPERTVVRSRLEMSRNLEVPEPGLLRLDGEVQELLSVTLDGRKLMPPAYQLDAAGLTLEVPRGSFVLEIESANEPVKNTALEGLYVTGETLCTQCEAEGFRRITYFADRPDVLAQYRVHITADAKRFPVLLSNGNKVASGTLPDGRHWVEWHDPFPKPCYLFALVAGDLKRVEDRFVTRSGREVALHLYVEAGHEPRALYAMEALKRAMKWDEDTYGLEYDLDIFQIVAVSEFNMGAMENKGLNIFNARFILADPETATDQDYAAIEAVIAHEYFHNWTGNRVTCRDWFQLSLKEGLTVFRDQQFSSAMRSAAVERINDVRTLRSVQFAEDEGPLAHPVRPESYLEINNFYTATVYEKGAEVIRMLETVIGVDAFRRGMTIYLTKNDGKAATVDDFVAAMEEASGRDLTQFRLWYSQAGTPQVSVHATKGADGGLTLTLRQRTEPTPGQPEKSPLHIPLVLGLVGADGRNVPVRLAGEPAAAAKPARVLDFTAAEQSFRLAGVDAKTVPSLFRGFSAPCKIVQGLSDEDHAFLLGHDSDPFNRWDAGQQFATKLILSLVARKADMRGIDTLTAAYARTLADDSLDPAFIALAISLPSERDLAHAMPVVDVEGIHRARAELVERRPRGLRKPLLDAYERLAVNAPYAPTAEQAGMRALRNAALRYLVRTGEPIMLALAEKQFDGADNMTDSIAALSILSDFDLPARNQVFERFFLRWQRNALVMDKWLSLQALSSLADTLDTVQRLMQHPVFSLKSPNKVRALVGAFAHGNQLRFHTADGAGYKLVADTVLALDPLNPQAASRLVSAFESWRRFDPGRQVLIQTELKRIAKTRTLSPNLTEMVERMLS